MDRTDRGFRNILILFISTMILSSNSFDPPCVIAQNSIHSFHKIRLKSYTFDVRDGEPQIPVTLRSKPQHNDYHLIKCMGPIHGTWKQVLETHVKRIYAYLPEYTYLVSCNTDEITLVRDLPFIEWVGQYHPCYKIDKSLLNPYCYNQADKIKPSNSQNAYLPHRDFMAQVFGGEDIGRIIKNINDRGAIVTDWSSGTIFHSIRFMVEHATFPEVLAAIVNIHGIAWVERYFEPKPANNDLRWVTQSYDSVGHTTPIWDHGLTGNGQIIGISDTGLDVDSCYFWDDIQGYPDETVNPDQRKVISYYNWIETGWGDPTGHGTHVAGTLAGDNSASPGGYDPGDGLAYNAQLVVQDVWEWSGSYISGIPSDLNLLYQQAYDDGARIHSNSWGSEGVDEYSAHAQHTDEFMWNHPDFLILHCAGNSGSGSHKIWIPGTAKNNMAVGATLHRTMADNIASFSSWGPAPDGRFKPTICLPGNNIESADGDALTSPPSYNCDLTLLSGTSQSTPAAAGCAALVRQYFMEGFYPTGMETSVDIFTPSAALIKGVLINSAVNMTTPPPIPSNAQGWGRVLLDNALYFDGDSRKLYVDDHRTGLSTDDTVSYKFRILSSSEPFKVTIVWTDYPSTPVASVNLVNDLNLEIITPANTFRGNNFVGGVSIPGGSFDNLNVEENVLIPDPVAGEIYIIKIIAENIPFGPQPYALVVTGDLEQTSTVIALNYAWFHLFSLSICFLIYFTRKF